MRLTPKETLRRGQMVLKGKPRATEGRAWGEPDPAAQGAVFPCDGCDE